MSNTSALIPGPSEASTARIHSLVKIPNDNGWSSQVPRHTLPGQHKGSLIPHDSTSKNPRQGKRRSSNYIPRPANSFILFRKDFVATRPPDFDSRGKTLSKLASEAWAKLSNPERKKWIDAARKESEEHAKLHPGWKYRPTPRSAKSCGQRSKRRASPSPSPGDYISSQSSLDALPPSNYQIPVSVPQPAFDHLSAPQPSQNLNIYRTSASFSATPPLPRKFYSGQSSILPVTPMGFEQGRKTHRDSLYAPYGGEGHIHLQGEPSHFPSPNFYGSGVSRVPSSSRDALSPMGSHSLSVGQLDRRTSMRDLPINWDMVQFPLRDDSTSPYSSLDSQPTLTPQNVALDFLPYSNSPSNFGNVEFSTGTLDVTTASLEDTSIIGAKSPSFYPFGEESLHPSAPESLQEISRFNEFLSNFNERFERQPSGVEGYDQDDHIIERHHVGTSANTLSLLGSTIEGATPIKDNPCSN